MHCESSCLFKKTQKKNLNGYRSRLCTYLSRYSCGPSSQKHSSSLAVSFAIGCLHSAYIAALFPVYVSFNCVRELPQSFLRKRRRHRKSVCQQKARATCVNTCYCIARPPMIMSCCHCLKFVPLLLEFSTNRRDVSISDFTLAIHNRNRCPDHHHHLGCSCKGS